MGYLGPVIVRFECCFSVVAVVKSRQISVGAFQVSVGFLCLSLSLSVYRWLVEVSIGDSVSAVCRCL